MTSRTANRFVQVLLTWAVVFSGIATLMGDEVLVIDSKGNERLRKGTIVDFRGETLTLELTTGNQVDIDSHSIKSIAAEWSQPQKEAEKQLAQRNFADALNHYRDAFKLEKRDWVKRQLRSRVVWCFRNTGRDADACRNFGRLVEEDPRTPYFDAIPLQWPTRRCPADVMKVVTPWMTPTSATDESAVKQLIAASWLLVNDRTRAVTTLRDLGRNSSKLISSLAVAQLWRAELLTLQESRMTWWSEQLASTPIELRAGSHYLMGQSLARFKKYDDAVLSFLRVPTMYPDDLQLSQVCLSEAANILLKQGHQQEARTIYQQTIDLDESSVWGQQAKVALAELR